MLIPLIFFVIFSCVWFCLHLHNRALLRFGCGRCAVSGRAFQSEELHFYLAESTSLKLDAGDRERTAAGSVQTVWFSEAGDDIRNAEETLSYQIVKPVSLLRRAHAVIELTEGE